MKYLVALFLLVSLDVFSQQKEITLQTHPEGQYVLAYSYGNHTLLFEYTDFLSWFSEDEKLLAELRQWMDTKINANGLVNLNASTQKFTDSDGEETTLKALLSNRMIARMINSGNLIVRDASGRETISSLIRTKEVKSDNDKGSMVYTDPNTGDVVFENKIRFVSIICPAF